MNAQPETISFVIPVYNGAKTILPVLDSIRKCLPEQSYEILLVNDGSSDDSESVCRSAAEQDPDHVVMVQLARNFGEHSAVMAGLTRTRGDYIAVLDDDGQNPPAEVLRMLEHLRTHRLDVVYGKYRQKKHSLFRNLGSWVNDRAANVMVKKPPSIYLSSFKVMTRFVVNQIVQYQGPFPYIDGLIFRVTMNVGQIDVEHRDRIAGESGYTLTRLFRLWLNMFLEFSILPLRFGVLVGLLTSVLSAVLLVGIVIDKVWLNPNVTIGIPTVLVCMGLFAGVQLFVTGVIGEYVGRVFLEQNGTPQYVVKYDTRSRDID